MCVVLVLLLYCRVTSVVGIYLLSLTINIKTFVNLSNIVKYVNVYYYYYNLFTLMNKQLYNYYIAK